MACTVPEPHMGVALAHRRSSARAMWTHPLLLTQTGCPMPCIVCFSASRTFVLQEIRPLGTGRSISDSEFALPFPLSVHGTLLALPRYEEETACCFTPHVSNAVAHGAVAALEIDLPQFLYSFRHHGRERTRL